MPNDEFSEDKVEEVSVQDDSHDSTKLFEPVVDSTVFKLEEQEAVLEVETEQAPEDESEDTEDVESFEGEEDFDYEQDPIENAFDLDKGRPMRGQRRRDFHNDGLPSNTKIESVKEFFLTEIIYRFDILNDQEREDLKGQYRFDLKESSGTESSWTVNIDQEINAEQERRDAGLVIGIQESDFLSLVNGKINPQLAVLANKIKYQGDITALFRINALLYPDD